MKRKKEISHQIDAHVGQRIKLYRLQAGLSQQALARQLGISYQQLHKYETGVNSVSASRIAELARVLKILPGSFFEGFGDGETQLEPDSMQRMTLLLARYFQGVKNPRHRDALHYLMRALAE